jgi:hypothetical protein
MIVLYVSLLLLLCGTHYVLRRRAASLERKYAVVLKEASSLLREPLPREGNSGRTDPYLTAKRNYQLGALAQKKEALETKHCAWQTRAEKVGRMLRAVRSWRGRKFPYLLGALDAVASLCLLEYLGLGEYASPHHLVSTLTSWLSS